MKAPDTTDASKTGEVALLQRLVDLGIPHENHRHPPLMTVDDSKSLRGNLPGGHIKNLFLRDKKKALFLVTVDEDRTVDLKSLRHRLGARGNLSFGSPDLLTETLGVLPGAVTPFAVMNDTEGRVMAFLDGSLLNHDLINAHPLHNEATTALAPGELVRFMRACGHNPEILDLDIPAPTPASG